MQGYKAVVAAGTLSAVGDLSPEDVIRLEGDRVVLLDQRRLPEQVEYLECCSVAEVVEAIRTLAVRGAPALGIAAAMGYALAASRGEDLEAAAAALLASRPTAVNLRAAIEEMRRVEPEPEKLSERARALHHEEIERCLAMSTHALELLPARSRPLTHCNTGALATGGHGTALGAIRTAFERGRVAHVYVDETRPLLQGSRLTAWELERAGIPYSVVVDSAAGALMARAEVTHVVTGADRIAANGDTANKIGTYGLAVLAAHHELPFVVVAPSSTIDLEARDGASIPIEERASEEVTPFFASRNPAFDVTPASLLTAIVTEAGVHRAPYEESLRAAVSEGHAVGAGHARPGRGMPRPYGPAGATADQGFER